MPLFSFSSTKKKNKTNVVRQNKYTILIKGLEGIVCINNEGKYIVRSNNTLYNIKPENYSCVGHSRIYKQDVSKAERICWIRTDKYVDYSPKKWLPFAPGVIVIGDIVKHNISNREMFNIKKVLFEVFTNESFDAFQYFKSNFDKYLKHLNE